MKKEKKTASPCLDGTRSPDCCCCLSAASCLPPNLVPSRLVHTTSVTNCLEQFGRTSTTEQQSQSKSCNTERQFEEEKEEEEAKGWSVTHRLCVCGDISANRHKWLVSAVLAQCTLLSRIINQWRGWRWWWWWWWEWLGLAGCAIEMFREGVGRWKMRERETGWKQKKIQSGNVDCHK